MSAEEPEMSTARPSTSRARLRRSGRQLVRAGAVLTVLALIVTLVSGFATRSMLDNLQTNSVEVLDGQARVPLTAGTERTLYLTGGLIAPGELVPTPLEQVSCAVTGPGGQPVPFEDRTSEGVGVDLLAARIQVVGHFTAEEGGTHLVECQGLGVVVSPGVEATSVVARLGGLALGSLGTVLGLTMLLIGGVLLLLRRGEDDDEDEVDEDLPPEEGAEEWWDEAGPGAVGEGGEGLAGESPTSEQGRGEALDRPGVAAQAPEDDVVPAEGGGQLPEDGYVDVSAEELAAMSDEEIEALVASGDLVFVDEDEDPAAPAQDEQTPG